MKGNNRYLIFSSVLLASVLLLLAWLGWGRMADYRHYHQELARAATAGVAAEIADSIEERERLVRLFAEEHLPLIEQTLSGDRSAAGILSDKIANYFPTHFTHTLTDSNGHNLFDDFEGLVGDMCLGDISNFLLNDHHQPRVHPHAEGYHYDVMSTFNTGTKEGVLFISFRAGELAGILRSAQAPGHLLMLVYAPGEDLIEITADGARNRWSRDDYRLDAAEKGRVLQRLEVAGTRWQILDLYEPALFRDYLYKLLFQSLVVAGLFVAVIGTMLFYLRKEERLRALAEQHKDEFLSNISHELRTPLTAITGSLSLVLNGVVGGVPLQVNELLMLAQRNCHRLAKLVNDLLDLKQMERGSFEYEWAPVQLEELIRRETESLAAYGERYGVSYRVEPPQESVSVRGDAVRLQQVLANLLSNAAKYGPHHSEVVVRVERDGAQVRIRVIDKGEGIAPALRKRLFQRFSRGDSSAQQKIGGAGLGLNISKKIIEDHGGTIDVEQLPGEGNCFYFELPLLEE